MKKYLLPLALIFILSAVGTRAYFRLTDDFRLANISCVLPHHREWDIPKLEPESEAAIDKILQQPFTYIGKGSQSYAFASADGEYVLKFFKFKHLRPHWLLETLSPLPYFNHYQRKQLKRKQRKLNSLFAGYRLAWESLREESGLLFIHLNKTKGLYPKAKLFDKIGLERTVDLDTVVFILQKKARTTRTVIDELLTKGDVATAKERIRQICALYASEYARGIYDMDHGVMHNTGFVGEQPIHLDIGKLTQEPLTQDPEFRRKDFKLVLARIDAWLEANYPQYRDQLLPIEL